METWKDIKGYEGLYKVSDHGRVMGLKRGKVLKNITNRKDGNNYLVVGIRLTPNLKLFTLSRLFYQTFIGEIKGRIDYKDGDFNNCKIENLIDVHKSFKYKNKICRRVLNTQTMQMYDSVSDLSRHLGTSQANLHARLKSGSKKYSHYKIID